MDQKKQGQQQSERFEGQQQRQGSQQQGPQTQNPNREPAEGARQTPGGGHEKGGDLEKGSDFEEHSGLEDRGGLGGGRGVEREEIGGRDRSGGITNRDLDREMSEQEELPERGRSRGSER